MVTLRIEGMTSWFALAKKVRELLTENDRFGPVSKGEQVGRFATDYHFATASST